MKCKKCAERREKARAALLRAAMGVKDAVAPKPKQKRTAKPTGGAGKTKAKQEASK